MAVATLIRLFDSRVLSIKLYFGCWLNYLRVIGISRANRRIDGRIDGRSRLACIEAQAFRLQVS